MIYVVYSFDHPFRASQAITPRAYEVVYNYYAENPTENPTDLKSPEDLELLH